MFPKPKQCEGCVFYDRGQGYVPGEGDPNARVALIGQGPGDAEVKWGRPFRSDSPDNGAPAGRKLNYWLHRAGYPLMWRWEGGREGEGKVWTDNVVRCRLRTGKKDEAPPAAIDECYNRHLYSTISKLPNLEWVVAIGAPASRLFLGPWAGLAAAGTMMEVELPCPKVTSYLTTPKAWPESVSTR